MATVQFDDVTTFILMLIGVMTFIVLTFNVSQAVRTWKNQGKQPLEKLEDKIEEIEPKIVPNLEVRLDRIEKTVERHEEKLQADWAFREETKDFERLMIESMKTLIEHSADSKDSKETESGYKELGKKLDRYLIDHHQ